MGNTQNLSKPTSRRRFLAQSSALTAGAAGFFALTSKSRAQAPQVIGHGDFKYKVVAGWGKLDPAATPVANCHEMVEDSQGRLILFQTDTKNNIVIYDKSGKLIESWGTTYPGAHGLDIVTENGEDFLFLTDTKLGKIFKTDLKGKVVMELGRPDLPQYQGANAKARWAPTNIMPAPDGTFYVGDGYGSSWVMQHAADGKILNIFGGKGKEPGNLDVPHGGIVDTRNADKPTLMICSRTDHKLKRFTLDGTHLETIPVPGLRVCQLANQGDYMISPSLEGVITVVDKNNTVVSNPGGSEPTRDANSNLTKIGKAADSPFAHPHGVWIDSDESVYVPQWNSGKTYPIKLEKV